MRLFEVEPTPVWVRFAACRGTDPELWFPSERGSSTTLVRDAKAICAECPARKACLEAALDRRERFGVWGGCSVEERRQLLKAGRAA